MRKRTGYDVTREGTPTWQGKKLKYKQVVINYLFYQPYKVEHMSIQSILEHN